MKETKNCTTEDCKGVAVSNQTVYGIPINLCEFCLLIFRDRFFQDKDLRTEWYLRSKLKKSKLT